MDGDKTNSATAVATSVSCCMNMLGGLAAPRVFPKLLQEFSEDELRQHIIEAIIQLEEVMAGVGKVTRGWVPGDPGGPGTEGWGDPDPTLHNFVAALSPIRDALKEQELSPPSGELVTAARAALAEFGIPEPPEGWDNWEPEE